MKQGASLVLACLLLVTSAVAERVDYSGEMVVSVVPERSEVLDFLMKLESQGVISFWGPEWKSTQARFDFQISKMNFGSLTKYFENNGLKASIMIEDLQGLIRSGDEEVEQRRMQSQNKEFDLLNFHRYDELVAFVQETSANSSLATFSTIGTTHEGREIAMVRVQVGGGVTNKSIIMLECGIHAREWIAPASCIWIFSQLVNGYGNNAEITVLLNTYDWLIVPCTNPDGYEYTWNTDRLWRKNRYPTPGSPCVGIDSNRNFGFNWGGEGSSGDPCSTTYRGSAPFSEAESSAVRDALSANYGRVKAFISVHSYASLWMTPFGHTSELPPDYNEMIRVMSVGVAALEGTYGTQFTLGNAADVLYFTSGGSRDYAYAGQNITYSCTIEVRDSPYGFIPPASEILPTAQETWNGIKSMVFTLP